MTERVSVVKRNLGEAGMQWVKDSLEHGFELSHAALATLDLAAGRVSGYYPPLPANVDGTRFEGSLFSPRGPFSDAEAGESEDAVIALAREIGGELWIVEGAVSAAQFAADREMSRPRAESGEGMLQLPHVAFWRPLHQGTTDDVAKFLTIQGGYDNVFTVGGRGTMSLVESPTPSVVLPRLARAIRAILVPTYDSESFVLWTGP